MSQVLVLRTSVSGQDSVSNRLIDEFLAKSLAKWPNTQVIERNLADDAIPNLTEETAKAIRSGVLETPLQRLANDVANGLIAEINQADYIFIGLPRYNFSVPASFKAYIDYIARPKQTFRYGENGSEGLLSSAPVYVFITSGGQYDAQDDGMQAWLSQTLSFLGLHDVHFICVDGIASGPLSENSSYLQAQKQMQQYVDCDE